MSRCRELSPRNGKWQRERIRGSGGATMSPARRGPFEVIRAHAPRLAVTLLAGLLACRQPPAGTTQAKPTQPPGKIARTEAKPAAEQATKPPEAAPKEPAQPKAAAPAAAAAAAAAQPAGGGTPIVLPRPDFHFPGEV